jgi:hypothetical protein
MVGEMRCVTETAHSEAAATLPVRGGTWGNSFA